MKKTELKKIISEEIFKLIEDNYQASDLTQLRLNKIKEELDNILHELDDKLIYLNNKKRITKDPDVDKDISFWKNIKFDISGMLSVANKTNKIIQTKLKRKIFRA